MPKKVSGFYYFMLDFKDKEEKTGRNFPGGLKDVQKDPKCSEAWDALSVAEKNKYNGRAKSKKQTWKLTGLGEPAELLQEKKRQQAEYEANMKEYIEQTVNDADDKDNLDLLTFYFIHVNHFYTKISSDLAHTDYFPAEYAVVEFSLKSGIKRIHHQIIKSEIQTGYTREYFEHSDSTHKLTNDIPEGETDYQKMYENLVEFLNPKKTLNKLPPLYTNETMKTIVPCLLERMTKAVDVDIMTFDLYSLEYLFGVLLANVDIKIAEVVNRAIIAKSYLERDTFTWSSNIECSYHLGIEGSGPYCSQSIVTRWAFIIADCCCKKLSIKMVPGSHCPMDSFINDFESMSMQKTTPSLKSEMREEGCRKKGSTTLTIIDYGKNPSSASSVISNYSAVSKASTAAPRVTSQTQMRLPKTMAKVFATDDVPIMNDDNFPAIGGGRGKPRVAKSELTKPGMGRGYGGT